MRQVGQLPRSIVAIWGCCICLSLSFGFVHVTPEHTNFCRSAANRLASSTITLTFINYIIGFLCRKSKILSFITVRIITECSVIQGLKNWLRLPKKQRNNFDYRVNVSVFSYITVYLPCIYRIFTVYSRI